MVNPQKSKERLVRLQQTQRELDLLFTLRLQSLRDAFYNWQAAVRMQDECCECSERCVNESREAVFQTRIRLRAFKSAKMRLELIRYRMETFCP